EIGDLNAQLASLRADLNGRDVQIGGLNADMEARDAQIGGLNVALDGKNAEIDGLNVELGDLRGQLADVDNELSGLNIDADTGVAVAGTGLGLAGLIGWLRSRKDSLETDVADRDGQLVALNAQVETDRVGYEQRIGGLNVDLEAKEAEIAALNARVGELDAELVASAEKHSVEVDGCLSDLLERENEINLLRGELASVQGELDGLTIDASGGSSGDADVNVAAMAGGGLGLAGLVAWLRGRKDSLETDVVDRDSQIVALNAKAETDAQTFEVERGQYGQRIVDLEAMLAERDVTIGTLQASMPPDDLTRVWGIGPKIAAALNAAGIKSYAQLAETEDDRITEILEASGVNYRLAGPAVRATWQEQAELLAAGELDELKLRQAQFKRSGGGLGKVWGIGSKVSGLLTAVGVTNYTELATSRTADISDALHAAKGYYPGMSNAEIHQSWVQQASMASNSQWTPLKNYQARFRRGRAAAAKPDDLKRIWGIGPKIEEVLNNSGITTFTRLAETSVAEIERILNESGSRFNMTSSDTLLANWTTQARLASVGNWDAFQELYDKLTWDNVQDED
ncbi:MAG: helix-hairpin-helix domain-containing protein, partial [Chloroflexota bacterium]